MAALQKQRIRIHLTLADYHKIKNIKVIQTLIFPKCSHAMLYRFVRKKYYEVHIQHFMPKNTSQSRLIDLIKYKRIITYITEE